MFFFFRGKENWHPEFRPLDKYRPDYLPVKFREKNPRKPPNYTVKKVSVPIADYKDK